MLTLAFAFLAGLLSILSPCVLPLLPIILSAALSEHKLGSLALASGLAVSFVAIGLFIALIGFSIGLNESFFQTGAAVLMVAFGLLLISSRLQVQFAAAGGPASNFFQQRFSGLSSVGLRGQFATGLLMGAVWSPCVGPTLGAASVLASQGKDIGIVALTMVSFGLGAALPLVVLSAVSRQTIMRTQNRLMTAGKGFKTAFGIVMIITGVFILSGLDKKLETFLVKVSPGWLTVLTTQF